MNYKPCQPVLIQICVSYSLISSQQYKIHVSEHHKRLYRSSLLHMRAINELNHICIVRIFARVVAPIQAA